MGAESRVDQSTGDTAAEAFDLAYDTATWTHGHGGYTGTLAEADGHAPLIDPATGQPFTPRPLAEAEAIAYRAINGDWDSATDRPLLEQIEKWGPALYVPVDDGRTWFFVGCYSC